MAAIQTPQRRLPNNRVMSKNRVAGRTVTSQKIIICGNVAHGWR